MGRRKRCWVPKRLSLSRSARTSVTGSVIVPQNETRVKSRATSRRWRQTVRRYVQPHIRQSVSDDDAVRLLQAQRARAGRILPWGRAGSAWWAWCRFGSSTDNTTLWPHNSAYTRHAGPLSLGCTRIWFSFLYFNSTSFVFNHFGYSCEDLFRAIAW